ncbi:MAG: peptidoglycan-associated lipoprotein Pal [Elusimicrobiota bacterium]
MKKLFIILAACVFVWGCAKKQTVKPQPIEPKLTAPVEQAAPPAEEPSVRYADWQPLPQIATVFFNYDQSDLMPSAREALKKNAEFIKGNPNLEVLVGGHCDERGTFEYNLALGQRRAAVVREYYGQLGVPLGRIATISYGEEMPANPGQNEAAWAKNRRAETKIRTKK